MPVLLDHAERMLGKRNRNDYEMSQSRVAYGME
jgi:hypothetical protein